MTPARPNRLSFAAALSAAALLCVPAPALCGEPATGHSAAAANDAAAAKFATQAVDVKLAGGVLNGRMVTDSGAAIAGVEVALHKSGTDAALAKAVTGEDGKFALRGVTAGTFVVSTPKGAQTVRTWAGAAAPPKALPEIALVSVDPAVRGQYGLFCDPALNLAMGIATAGVVLSAITLGEIDDLKDDNDSIRDSLDDIVDAVSP